MKYADPRAAGAQGVALANIMDMGVIGGLP